MSLITPHPDVLLPPCNHHLSSFVHRSISFACLTLPPFRKFFLHLFIFFFSPPPCQYQRKQNYTCQCRRRERHGFDPWVGKIPSRRAQQPTPVSLPGESHGQRSLVGYSPWGRQKSRTQLKRLSTVAFAVCSKEVKTPALEK